jgi:CRP/FNR family transcriptional regulator, cyclic AMP receptor protein
MWLVIAGWLASALAFVTFLMRTMIPLRVVGMVTNVAFMSYALLGLAYGVFGRLYPIFVLHACLLPLNFIRLRQQQRLVEAVRTTTDERAIEALIPHMKTQSFAAGDVIFRRGDPAEDLYLLQEGTVLFPEIEKRVEAGPLFGEVGLFAAKGERALTAVCEEDCRVSKITKEKTLQLYYENPKFGLFLIRMVSDYARENLAPVEGGRSPSNGEEALGSGTARPGD